MGDSDESGNPDRFLTLANMLWPVPDIYRKTAYGG